MTDYRYVNLPNVGDLVRLLPDQVVDAAEHSDKIRLADNEAQSRVARCHAAIPVAEKQDTEALAAALGAGEPDPGPVHLEAAKADLADAIRKAEAYDVAVIDAGRRLDAALRTTDFRPVVDELEAKAADALQQVRSSFAAARLARDDYNNLRSLAVWLGHYPNQQPMYNDGGGWRIAQTQIDQDLDAIGITPSSRRTVDAA